MSSELLLVLGLLAACITLFIIDKPRMDVVALMVIIILPLTGIITVPEALAGFSDPNVLLIAALFVIGECLVRTGVAYHLGEWLTRRAGSSEARLIILLMLVVAGLGAFMSSTGIVAIFIPVVLGIARQSKIHPRRLMMPLSVAGLISGMMTLVATPPNMVVDSALKSAGYEGLGFFSVTPFGVVVLALAIGYMLVARKWLTPPPDHTDAPVRERLTLEDMVRGYDLSGRAHRLKLQPNSPLAGRTLCELNTRREYGANIVAIERHGLFRWEYLEPRAETRLAPGDILLVDAPGAREGMPFTIPEHLGLVPQPLNGSYFTDQSRAIGMAEVLIPPNSALEDRTVLQAQFRRKHGLHVIGMRRGQHVVDGVLVEQKLRAGDTLLVVGSWKAIRNLQSQLQDILVLSLPAEMDRVAPAASQAPFALAGLGLMVVLMVTGIVPNVFAALIACLFMGLFRCIDMNSAYKSIHWQSLVLIVGMIPFAMALQKTGGIELAVNSLLHLFGNATPRILIAALFVMTAVVSMFISNTATAVLMAPIALSAAAQLGVAPHAFVITVALAASAAFMTPVSSPVNTLVLGPGQYRFMDFVKVGVPLTILVMLVTVFLVPIVLPT